MQVNAEKNLSKTIQLTTCDKQICNRTSEAYLIFSFDIVATEI